MAKTLAFWVRLAAHAVLGFGTLVAVVNPIQVFFPVSIGLVTLMFAAGLLWLLTSKSWFRGPAILFEIGGAAGMLVLVLFALTRSPAVREKMTVAAALGHAPDLGLGTRTYYFNPKYGPRMVRSDRAMESRCGWVRSSNPIVQDRGELAYCYASLRLRGRTDAQILADPATGPTFFLGTLAAESYEPFWWKSSEWLKKDLPLHPAAGWKMGLLPPDWARATFQNLAAEPAHEANRLEALLFIALQRPGFATPAQIDSMLETWAALRTTAGFSIEPALALHRQLAASPIPSIRFEFPADWTPEFRAAYSATLQPFLQAPASDQGATVHITANYRKWDGVRYTFHKGVHREVVEQHGGGIIRAGSVSIATSPYSTRRDVYDKVRKEERGPLAVPTLLLEIGGKPLQLPPSSLVSREVAEDLSECDPKQAKSGISRDIYEEFLAAMTLEPWRFGLYWPLASDDEAKRDEAMIPRENDKRHD